MLTQNELKQLIHYNPDTGVVTWLKRDPSMFTDGPVNSAQSKCRTWNTKNSGKRITSTNNYGYLSISIWGKRYLAHRLSFLYMLGFIPKEVDHINGVRLDIRWCNLREVTRTQNCMNTKIRSDNTSGVVGVYWNNQFNRWECYINKLGKRKYLGRHQDFFEAVCVRKSAELTFGFHKNHGRAV